jgi:sugar phosphate isomerase/epimerase
MQFNMSPVERRGAMLSRRDCLQAGAKGLALLGPFAGLPALLRAGDQKEPQPTRFQIACMTLPYARFPLARALSGIKQAGYQYVAWGTTHRDESGIELPVMPPDATPAAARDLADRCRDSGLEPLMMFSMVYPEHDNAVAVLTSRIQQAAAARIPQVLSFGHTEGSKESLWIERLKRLAPVAHDAGVMLVIKQHGGNTGTGEALARIVDAVAHPAVWVNYDAGNVMDYLNLDPIPDLRKCAARVRSFCIKDHRDWPKDEDCGPGFGEIDHYKLLAPVAFTGLTMPLCCENLFAPLVPRPAQPEEVDRLALRAREFLETVIAGLQSRPHGT